jgi:hypothetical protein
MKEPNVDSIIMLLSTDWFFSHWSRIGIRLTKAERSLLQQGFREILTWVVSGAEQYYFVSFAPERIQETFSRVKKLLERSGLPNSKTQRIQELIEGRPRPIVEDKTAWLLLSITQMLRDSSLGDLAGKLPPSVEKLLCNAYVSANSDTDAIDFEKENLASTCAWDQYVRKLTPALPTCLSDYLSMDLLKQGQFERFWNDVCSTMTDSERKQTLDWYRLVGSALTGEELCLPAALLEC